jgi:hypothetical protein
MQIRDDSQSFFAETSHICVKAPRVKSRDYALVINTSRKLHAKFDIVKEVIGQGRLDILDKAGVACGGGKGFDLISLDEKRFRCVLEGINVEFRHIATEDVSENEFMVKWLVHANYGLANVTTLVDHTVTRTADGELFLTGTTKVEAGKIISKIIDLKQATIQRAAEDTTDFFARSLEEISSNPSKYLEKFATIDTKQPVMATSLMLLPGRKSSRYKFTMLVESGMAHIRDEVELEPQTWKGLVEQLDDLQVASTVGTRGEPAERHAELFPKLVETGRSMFMLAVPNKVKAELKQTTGYLRVTAPTELFHVPWELLHDDENFLGVKYAMGRLILSDEPPKSASRVKKDKVKFLLVADPTSDLPSALQEVEAIERALNAGNMRSRTAVTVWRRSDVSKLKFLRALATGDYDIIHFAGHGYFDDLKPEHSYLRFPANDGQGWIPCYPFELEQALGTEPPAVVFANACSSAKEPNREKKKKEGKRKPKGFPQALIDGGVKCYVGSMWEVHDVWAGRLASAFYENIVEGSSFGEAMRKAREKVFRESKNEDLTWAAMVMYGDPALTLELNPESPSSRRDVLTHRIA